MLRPISPILSPLASPLLLAASKPPDKSVLDPAELTAELRNLVDNYAQREKILPPSLRTLFAEEQDGIVADAERRIYDIRRVLPDQPGQAEPERLALVSLQDWVRNVERDQDHQRYLDHMEKLSIAYTDILDLKQFIKHTRSVNVRQAFLHLEKEGLRVGMWVRYRYDSKGARGKERYGYIRKISASCNVWIEGTQQYLPATYFRAAKTD